MLFSGGEIFLRKDTLEIIAHARSRHMLVRLITHGGRITDEIADRLADLGVHEVVVSLYSMVAEDHEAVTRREDSHARTVAGIRRLRDRNVPMKLNIPVMNENAMSWPSVMAFAEELGCDTFISSEIFAKDDLDAAHIDAMNVGFTQRIAVERLKLERELAAGRTWERTDPAAPEEDLCGAANFSAFIDPYGKVFPCAVFYEPAGDLAEQRFQDIWSGSKLMDDVRAVGKSSFTACRGCSFLQDCNHCVALNFMHTGDMTGRSDLMCAATHARFIAAHELGLHPTPVPRPPHLLGLRKDPRPPCAIGPGMGADSACATPVAPALSEVDLAPVPNLLEMALRS